jgi:hypothetical protein
MIAILQAPQILHRTPPATAATSTTFGGEIVDIVTDTIEIVDTVTDTIEIVDTVSCA